MTAAPKYTSLEEIDEIYATLNKTFRSGKTKSIDFRKDQLARLAYMYSDNLHRIVDALGKDIGRPTLEALFTDAQSSVTEAIWAYDHIDEWIKPEPVEPHPLESLFNPVMEKMPKGVCLMITAYNFPMYTLRGLCGAIAAGCPVIIKPSELLPAMSALLAEIFPKYLDPSAYRLVFGGIEETTHLIKKPYGHLLFIGSTRVGAIVAAAAGQTLTPVTLELGGKNPCFVHSTADMDAAAKRILWSTMLNAGQTCLSPDYVVVLEKDKDAFMKAFLKAYEDFYGTGNPRDSIALLKPGRSFERVHGKIVAGGDVDAEAKYIAPTIITDVSWDDALMQEEIFGPLIPVITVPDYETALEKARELGEPLAGYSFHQDDEWANHVRESLLTGSWSENEAIIGHGSLTTPQCGVGRSGMGRGYKGKTSFMEFSHLRPSYKIPDLDVVGGLSARYPPYTNEKYEIFKSRNPTIDIPRPAGI